jgi:hypothetical protein
MLCKHHGQEHPDECDCQCKTCWAYRDNRLRLKRVEELEARLRKADIHPEDLAEIVWVRLEMRLEGTTERVTREVLRSLLKNLHLRSEIVGTSIDLDRS